MIFLAESGSTKTDAVLLEDDGREVCRFSTMGFNPYFHSADLIARELGKISELREHRAAINQVYFYGAGCSSEQLCKVVSDGLHGVLPHASVQVDHDLKACAYATYSGTPAISCILGTGSNSVLFDGNNLSGSNAGMGFILADEGSASYIGKKLLNGYFYKLMPEEYRILFEREYNLDKNHVVKRVYREERANVYLASLAPFASEHLEVPFFWELVFNGFRKFIDYHVLCFPEATEVPIHFVGSIAHYFREVLVDAVDYFNLQLGKVVQRPLDGLIEYHRQYILSSSTS